MSRVVLAVDAGSTGTRVLLIDREGRLAHRGYRESVVVWPEPGRVEIDLAAFEENLRALVGDAMRFARNEGIDVAAVGVTGQRSTAVAWDRKTRRPLARAIGWQDLRAAARSDEVGAEGHFVPPQAAALKLEWLLRNDSGVREAVDAGRAGFGTLESWIVAFLSGSDALVTDASFASASGLFDFFSNGWNLPLLELLGIPPEAIPEIHDSSEVVARTDAELFGAEIPIAGVAGDQQAAMFGQLRTAPGDLKASYGTSTMIDLNVGENFVLSERGAWPMVLWRRDGRIEYLLEGSLLTSGAMVRWLRDSIGLLKTVEQIDELARSVADTGGVWVVPALQGLGTPYQDAAARGAIGGLSLASDRAHIARATLEGIAHRCAEIVDALVPDSPCGSFDVLRADGGAAASDFLLQFQADLLGFPVERPEVIEAAALGAAFLAGRAVGFWESDEELAEAWRPGRAFEPSISEEERQTRRALFAARLAAVRSIP